MVPAPLSTSVSIAVSLAYSWKIHFCIPIGTCAGHSMAALGPWVISCLHPTPCPSVEWPGGLQFWESLSWGTFVSAYAQDGDGGDAIDAGETSRWSWGVARKLSPAAKSLQGAPQDLGPHGLQLPGGDLESL